MRSGEGSKSSKDNNGWLWGLEWLHNNISYWSYNNSLIGVMNTQFKVIIVWCIISFNGNVVFK